MIRPIRIAAVVAAVMFVPAANAATFAPVIDEFWISKNGTEIFRDRFDDGALPPSGPDGASTYAVAGANGFTSETGGRASMMPSLGEPVLITSSYADLFTGALRALSPNPLNPNALTQADAFSVHALYDLSNLPGVTGQSFGIRVSDRSTTNPGEDIVALLVGMNLADQVFVRLASLDIVNGTDITVTGFSIENYLADADQIELVLSKVAGSTAMTAAFTLFDRDIADPANQAILVQAMASGSPLLEIYNVVDFTRGQFFSTDRVPIPEPTSFALLGVGLAGLEFVRRTRRG